jgi:hypothetical protein
MNNYLNIIQDILNWREVGNLGVWFVLNDDTQNFPYLGRYFYTYILSDICKDIINRFNDICSGDIFTNISLLEGLILLDIGIF